jgi:hypothetical protein
MTIEELQKHLAREAISGNFRAIQAATPELERRKLGVDDYHIVVFRLGTSLFVLFGNPEDALPSKRPRHKDCAGPRRCFSVELSVDDLRSGIAGGTASCPSGGTASCPSGGTYLVQTAQLASDGSTQIGPISATYFDQLGHTIAASCDVGDIGLRKIPAHPAQA